MVFQSQNFVIKVPHVPEGEVANQLEYANYKAEPSNKARCRLIKLNGLQVIVMEKVRRVHDPSPSRREPPEEPWPEDPPAWVYRVDAHQVGYNRKGELVAYDYAGI